MAYREYCGETLNSAQYELSGASLAIQEVKNSIPDITAPVAEHMAYLLRTNDILAKTEQLKHIIEMSATIDK